jgi:hypothetical protein
LSRRFYVRVVGQLILIEGTEQNSIAEIESAVDEGVVAYQRRFPDRKDLLVYIHGKTRERWDVNGSVRGLEAYQDDDIPAGYVWIIQAADKGHFRPKKID